MYVCTYVRTYVCICMYVHMYVRTYACMYMYVYMYVYRHDVVQSEDCESAVDRVIGGVEKRNSVMTAQEVHTKKYHIHA